MTDIGRIREAPFAVLTINKEMIITSINPVGRQVLQDYFGVSQVTIGVTKFSDLVPQSYFERAKSVPCVVHQFPWQACGTSFDIVVSPLQHNELFDGAIVVVEESDERSPDRGCGPGNFRALTESLEEILPDASLPRVWIAIATCLRAFTCFRYVRVLSNFNGISFETLSLGDVPGLSVDNAEPLVLFKGQAARRVVTLASPDLKYISPGLKRYLGDSSSGVAFGFTIEFDGMLWMLEAVTPRAVFKTESELKQLIQEFERYVCNKVKQYFYKEKAQSSLKVIRLVADIVRSMCTTDSQQSEQLMQLLYSELSLEFAGHWRKASCGKKFELSSSAISDADKFAGRRSIITFLDEELAPMLVKRDYIINQGVAQWHPQEKVNGQKAPRSVSVFIPLPPENSAPSGFLELVFSCLYQEVVAFEGLFRELSKLPELLRN